MKSKFLNTSLVMMALVFGGNAMAETVYTNIQCWAEGNNFRVNGDEKKNNLASARLFLKVIEDESNADQRVLAAYIGHISGQKFVDGQKVITATDFYSQFQSKSKDDEILSSLSPRARKYKDDKYFRFRDFSSDRASYHDGGDMSGTLVISKKYEDREAETFSAHYIFQHGDHTGGTMDFTCVRD